VICSDHGAGRHLQHSIVACPQVPVDVARTWCPSVNEGTAEQTCVLEAKVELALGLLPDPIHVR
jgi:hypothetical protein